MKAWYTRFAIREHALCSRVHFRRPLLPLAWNILSHSHSLTKTLILPIAEIGRRALLAVTVRSGIDAREDAYSTCQHCS